MKKKKEGNGILAICLLIIVLLICLVGIFDFMIYGEIKQEKNDGIIIKQSDIIPITPSTEHENNKIASFNNGNYCIDNNCSTLVTLGNYTIEYKENKTYINNNEINIDNISSISLVDNTSYLLINNNVIYNVTTNTINNINPAV